MAPSSSNPPPCRVSSRFDSADSDIAIQSSDNVLFKIHRINLAMFSQVFSDAAGSTVAQTNETVHLTESAEVLELMLQYIYLQPQPDLRHVRFDVLAALAEAVEKYQIYCAMGVCSQRMKECISSHPVEVLMYSVRHKREEIINECAEATIAISATEMLKTLPGDIFAAWMQYYHNWHALMQKEYGRYGPTRHHRSVAVHHCEIWAENYALIGNEIGGKPSAVVNLASLLEKRQQLLGGRCDDCKRELGHWYHQFTRDRDNIPKFSTYL
ncbi:hypothetical protein CYLTODRAFT_451494 [Cylindrobasidium torrendii FP15055 ss-10]|uniref:BTB domain-containing protein n=1 Tax=Cylindrobasidium torrendii FP15055 ss-10 TaxID=1314674 RepID=A0A0D7BKK7_9AGAR|nr:hypothetical protein CYLTODRAFT_451494 [Cylindrobasidium torrendii FP15055 ss-10]